MPSTPLALLRWLTSRSRAVPAALALLAVTAPVRPAGPEGVEFFEKRIRPVLAEHCYRCHSAEAAAQKKLRGGLRLDTREGLLAGGDSGPALVPGKPAASLILQTLKYEGDVHMPPRGKLPAAVVADFEQWIAQGAPDPRQSGRKPRQVGLDLAAGRNYWAYKPPIRPPVPPVKDAAWPAGPVDHFILARLEAQGLRPAPDADAGTLARRLYYDLVGLPPPPEVVDAFLRESATEPQAAYAALVERLLASPAFGERWARHWLDLARYADSVTLRGFVFPDAWRYRDYVLGAFRHDVPLDRFIREQLAGDLLPAATPADRARQLVATTYLMLGNTNLEEQDKKQLRMDVVDEQLDVISKGLLAQTVTCARCHDHKFDPIPTRDYYALAGILRNTRALEHANVSKWLEMPLPAPPEVEAAVKQHAAAVAALTARLKAAKAQAPADAGPPAKGVLAVKDVPGVVVDDAHALKVGKWKDSTFNGTFIGAGYCHDEDADKGHKSITFQPEIPATGKYEIWLAYSPGGNRAARVPVTVFCADGEKLLTIDMTKNPPLEGRFVSLGQYRCEKDGQSFVLISNEGTRGHVTADAVAFIPADKVPHPRAAGQAPGADVAALEAEMKKLQAAAPKRPLAMAPAEEAVIEDARIHVRGSVKQLGEVAPRGFLQVANHGPAPKLPADQSGRVQLADWIASAENPLTARVYVNRVWHWLFGAGLVRTVDNFGTTGEPPSHPELLDWLAVQFVEDGWSTRRLVRRIVLSRAYRQAATADPATAAADPENRLVGRANRRRLDAECLRDTMLSVSGQLRDCPGGPTFPAGLAADYGFKQTAPYRSVYLPVFRNALPELFEVFDFADPSMVTGRRTASTVAPQALYLLNNPFVLEQARHAAARLLAEGLPDDAARFNRACRLTLGRAPTAGEYAVFARFVTDRPPREAWAAVFQALFASADFRYVE